MLQVETIRVVLKKELDLPIIEISDQNAKLDGSDVLFTGNQLSKKYINQQNVGMSHFMLFFASILSASN